MQHQRTPVRRFALLAMMFAIIAAMAVPAVGQTDGPSAVPGDVVDQVAANKQAATYIIWMAGDPVVAYDGSIKGLPATAPKAGQKINPNSAKVTKYQDYLAAQADELLASVGAEPGEKLYQYSVVFAGFAAELTGAQAAALSADANVLGVFEDELMQVDTVSTPDFLGLTGEGGAWENGALGEDVVIGIIDSGVWPENPAFSDRTGENPKDKDGKLGYRQIPGWHGKCVPGDSFTAADCNQKLIGAQFYGSGWGGEEGVRTLFPYEFWSPRDADGHGSHTASTAGGNSGVEAVVNGIDLGETSGIAPRARVAAYKVCWGIAPDGGCFGSDSVAAIDQAVADGVDVLNFSISGTSTNFLDPVEIAFLFAADAGVFVAASAGNSGPASSTVAHPSPWITTVAAGTHDRYSEATVELGSGEPYVGASLNQTRVSGDLVYAGDAGDELCNLGALDSAIVSGKIVVCDRGVIARVEKSEAVAVAGGIGMVLANTEPASLNADLHSVPSVHVDHVDGAAIRSYSQTEGATASIGVAGLVEAEAPFVAAFSSRGPLLASSDLLKPDVMAPGVDILAAVSPYSSVSGGDFDFYSGTSMSSPHVAGLAAGIMSVHPEWSPAMVKSALMTTAGNETNFGNPIPGTPFDWGSGHVVPTSALDPGLVYNAGFLDYFGFLCGTGQLVSASCASLEIDPSDLNQPNIAIGELPGSQTVTRTVTNVGPAATFEVSMSPPAGVEVDVSPDTLTLGEGETASYEVTFTATEAASIGDYTFGSLTWSDGDRSVRSQLVVRPVQLAAPDELSATGSEGELSYDVSFGYSGDFTAASHGLEPATTTEGSVGDDPADDINTALATCDFSTFPFDCVGVTWHLVSVPDGTAHTRISLFDRYTDGDDDLDLYVWDVGFGFMGGSGSPTSAEQVDLAFPAPGLYLVAVHGWQTDGPDANYTLFDWSVSATPGGSLSIDAAPTSAELGTTETIELSWSGLDTGTKYLGAVSYSDSGGLFGLTLVGVETD